MNALSHAARTSSGLECAFLIRDLRATQIPACESFFNRLDPRDVRMRFATLRFCDRYFIPSLGGASDGLALAAIQEADTIVGVANLVPMAAGKAEAAVIVRSDLKRRGIGRTLIAAVIDRAERLGLRQIMGLVNSENYPMLALARSMGFQLVRWDSYLTEVRRVVARGADVK